MKAQKIDSQVKPKAAFFHKFSKCISKYSGSPITLFIAFLVIIIWLLTGPFFNYSDTWQLIINTTTTIVTFLLAFIIQNSQYRETEAMQIKLDELIKVHKKAKKSIINLDDLTDEQLLSLEDEYKKLKK